MNHVHRIVPASLEGAAQELRVYLAALRASTGLTQRQFAEQYYGGSQSDQARYESGAMLPNRARVGDLSSGLSREEANQLETLVIRARLERATGMERRGNRLAAAMERSEVPSIFAEETLRRTNDPQGWAARDDLPAWADCVKPAAHRGHYLQAARQVLGLSGEEVSKGEGGHFASVLRTEQKDRGPLKDQLAEYYAQQLNAANKAQLFDNAVFAALPGAPPRLSR